MCAAFHLRELRFCEADVRSRLAQCGFELRLTVENGDDLAGPYGITFRNQDAGHDRRLSRQRSRSENDHALVGLDTAEARHTGGGGFGRLRRSRAGAYAAHDRRQSDGACSDGAGGNEPATNTR